MFVVLSEGQQVIQVGHLAKMRTNWVQEDQLQEDVPFYQVGSWFVLVTVQNVQIFHTCDLMQTVFDHISVDHLLVGLLHSKDLLLNLVLEDLIVQVKTLVVGFALTVSFLLV